MFREFLVSIYTTDEVVLSLTMTLLTFVVFFLFFDASQTCCVGHKDTRVPMWIALFSYWAVGFPTQLILGFGYIGEPMGVYGFWTGLAIGVGLAALLLAARLWYVSGNIPLIEKLSRESDRQSIAEDIVPEGVT